MPTRLALLAATALLAGCGAAAGPGAGREAQPRAAGPVIFVQETRPSLDGKEALNTGVLTLDADGCFRVGPGGAVLVWPAEAALDLTEPGAVKVFDRQTGAVLRVGERVALGGGTFAQGLLPPLSRPVDPCKGPVWDVDSFQTAADFEGRYPHMRQAPGAPPPNLPKPPVAG